jgi:hypothetical protein
LISWTQSAPEGGAARSTGWAGTRNPAGRTRILRDRPLFDDQLTCRVREPTRLTHLGNRLCIAVVETS